MLSVQGLYSKAKRNYNVTPTANKLAHTQSNYLQHIKGTISLKLVKQQNFEVNKLN